jgi:hypothetical protein
MEIVQSLLWNVIDINFSIFGYAKTLNADYRLSTASGESPKHLSSVPWKQSHPDPLAL